MLQQRFEGEIRAIEELSCPGCGGSMGGALVEPKWEVRDGVDVMEAFVPYVEAYCCGDWCWDAEDRPRYSLLFGKEARVRGLSGQAMLDDLWVEVQRELEEGWKELAGITEEARGWVRGAERHVRAAEEWAFRAEGSRRDAEAIGFTMDAERHCDEALLLLQFLEDEDFLSGKKVRRSSKGLSGEVRLRDRVCDAMARCVDVREIVIDRQ